MQPRGRKSAKFSEEHEEVEESSISSDEEEDEVESSQNDPKLLKQVQNRTPKEQLVADILCRWWYVLPDWPPADFDYALKMKDERLRVVALDKWEDSPDVDSHGFMKCYALTQYKGMFRDAMGNIRDLRPLEGKPCFSQLILKSEKELQQMLSTALTKQIEVLSASSEKNTGPLLVDLKERLKNVGKKK
jgi:hypothetical protein